MKSTIKATSVAFILAVTGVPALTSTSIHAAGIPVFDGVSATNFVQQMIQMKQQLTTLRGQLTQAEQMYNSVTGVRGFGHVLRDPSLREHLPEDAASLYDSGYAGISGTISEIVKSEYFGGGVDDMLEAIEKRQTNTAVTNKAIGRHAYIGAVERLDQIEGLIDQISTTTDQKGIDELQARIAGEQATIQNELTKLSMLRQLQVAEQQLITEQRREMSRRIFDSDLKVMPKIK